MFQAVKSKFKSATEYQIVICLEEAIEFHKAKKRIENEKIYNQKELTELKQLINRDDDDEITKAECINTLNKHLMPKDALNNHWYRWFQLKCTSKPSTFLEKYHKDKIKLLRKRKQEQYKKSTKNKKYFIDGHDITKLKKRELYDWMLNRELFNEEQNKSTFTKWTKIKLLDKAKKDLEPLIKEKEIDCNIDKLWETRNKDDDFTLMNWAYQFGLLQMWRDKIYQLYSQHPNNSIVNMELPFWPRETARYQQYKKDEYNEKFKPIIEKLWNEFIKEDLLKSTAIHCNLIDTNSQHTDEQLLHIIIQSYMENPLTIESILYYYNEDEETELPKSLSYLGNYPKYIQTKYWHDINFDLWNTTLSRVQVTCSCKSGEQLPSCCAHCSSIMWLLHYSVSLEGTLEEALSEKSKDTAIKYHLVDLLPHHNYEKKRQEIWKKLDTKYNYGDKLCICNQVTKENVIRCHACGNHYHPSCLHQTWNELHEHCRVLPYWRCTTCDENAYFINKNLSNI